MISGFDKEEQSVGRLERVALREVWKHEAYDFSQWLQENIDILNNTLGLNLTDVEKEKSAGSFSIDLVANDENGRTVVIENQLEKSDHNHLGKIITYSAAMGATAAIWIVSHPRPEHVAAITWLNESSSADFYMVKVEAVRIGTSPAAPLFTLIVGPSEESKEIGQTKMERAERYHIRKQWWTQLISKSSSFNKLHSHITPSQTAWIGTSSGVNGLNLNYVVRQNNCAVELYIDRGKGSEAENFKIFDQLYSNKADIENSFGKSLKWERLEESRACRIAFIQDGGYRFFRKRLATNSRKNCYSHDAF